MAAEKGIVSGVSGRYAVALFELAEAGNSLTEISTDLTGLQTLVSESGDFATFLTSPLYSREEQGRAVTAIGREAGVSALTGQFLGVLAENRRLASLEAVIRDFAALLSHARGEVTADVTAAHALSSAEIDALKQELKSAIGQDVAVNAHVDETLIGGLVVKVGSRMIDSSLKTKLNNLQVAMKGIG